jgi:hypothetical protein
MIERTNANLDCSFIRVHFQFMERTIDAPWQNFDYWVGLGLRHIICNGDTAEAIISSVIPRSGAVFTHIEAHLLVPLLAALARSVFGPEFSCRLCSAASMAVPSTEAVVVVVML